MQKPILVTGAHLSSSTWIGKIISSAPGVKYIHEPFNVGIKRYQHKSPLKYWFEYIPLDADKNFQEKVVRYLETFYKLNFNSIAVDLFRIRSVKNLKDFALDLKERVTTNRQLYKDPIAILSSEWIAKTMDADIVISVRHPAAFVASLKVKKWDFDFSNFLEQQNLINEYLEPYKQTIQDYAINKPNVVEQGILLWNIIYSVTKKFQLKFGNTWQIVRNEDLSKNPIQEFESIFKKLNLTFTNKVKNEIYKTTGGMAYNKISRDSKENITTWKKRLTDSEINRIREGTQLIWPHFYSELDWE